MDGALGRLVDEVRGTGGRQWAGSVEDLLFEGETIRRRVSVGDNRVVVTSHRLLAFTPTHDGENYRQVDLPNVSDVRTGHDGERQALSWAGQLFALGGVLLAVGVFVDFGSFVPSDPLGSASEGAGRLGVSGAISSMQSALEMVAMIDDLARLAGAGLVLLGVFALAAYFLTRDAGVLLAVAGDEDDVFVPAGDAAVDDAVSELEAALFGTGDAGDHGGEGDPAGVGADDPL